MPAQRLLGGGGGGGGEFVSQHKTDEMATKDLNI